MNEPLVQTIHGKEFEFKSAEILSHPDVILSVAGSLRCEVILNEKDGTEDGRDLKFTFDMKRGNMTDQEIKWNCNANAIEAVRMNYDDVIAKQTRDVGFRAVERD